eukprot:8101049-Pyramimonas_sp.AAC.1
MDTSRARGQPKACHKRTGQTEASYSWKCHVLRGGLPKKLLRRSWPLGLGLTCQRLAASARATANLAPWLRASAWRRQAPSARTEWHGALIGQGGQAPAEARGPPGGQPSPGLKALQEVSPGPRVEVVVLVLDPFHAVDRDQRLQHNHVVDARIEDVIH